MARLTTAAARIRYVLIPILLLGPVLVKLIKNGAKIYATITKDINIL